MNRVDMKCVKWNPEEGSLQEAIQQCMKWYGYGYEKVIAALEYPEPGGIILIATEHVELGDTELDMVLDYYEGDSTVRHLMSADNKELTLED